MGIKVMAAAAIVSAAIGSSSCGSLMLASGMAIVAIIAAIHRCE